MTTTQEKTAGTAATSNSGAGNGAGGGQDEAGRLAAVRQTAAEAYEAARERTAAALSSARETATAAGRRTGESIDANPVGAVIGGLALGAIVAALLPKTQREEDLLGPVGRRINETARDAARAAKESGREQLDELGLSREGVRRRLDEFTDKAVGAVRSSAGAAGGAARDDAGV